MSKKAFKAMTEFCFNGVRYATGEIVPAAGRAAQKLIANRLVYEVHGEPAEEAPPETPPETPAETPADSEPAKGRKGRKGRTK